MIRIAEEPYRLGKPLRAELEGQHVARRGAYRIIYTIDAEQRAVMVRALIRRADAYRPR